ncbi:MAG: hypothetical protein WCH39_24930 [Schlesneria sp.]
MNPYQMQEKLNQWTEKVQLKQNEFNERELTMIGWATTRIVIPVQTGDRLKRSIQGTSGFDQ